MTAPPAGSSKTASRWLGERDCLGLSGHAPGLLDDLDQARIRDAFADYDRG
jgi:hypothetical protein